jgi:hypothetical protein
MDADSAQESSERDQFWASLRALRDDIDRLASGEFDDSPRQRQILMLLARIVAAELDFRARDSAAE